MSEAQPADTHTPRPERIAVWGSCVSRDMWPYADEKLNLAGYVARQSAVSANHPIELPHGETGLESPFQDKQVRGDAAADVVDRLKEADPDLILIDLVDERLGLIEVDDGYVTRSGELRDSTWHDALLERGFQIDFGFDEHFQLWSTNFAVMLFRIREALPNVRFVLNKTPFALLDKNGEHAPNSLGFETEEWNRAFDRYYNFAQSLPIDVIELPQYLAISDPDHQWGHAPFHYVPEAYEYMIKQIEALLDEPAEH